MSDERELLRESFERILATDRNLADQLDKFKALAAAPDLRPTLEGVQERVGGGLELAGPDFQLSLETIVNRVGRPVLEVFENDYVVDGPEVTAWEARLKNPAVQSAVRPVLPSVGRIELENHPDLTWVGTGWLIADDVVVTNRHVANEFAAPSTAGGRRSFVFKRGWPPRADNRMAARVDFLRELRNPGSRPFAVKEVLHIEDEDGPDFAFLRVERTGTGGPLTPSLRPADAAATARQYVATVGYPAADSRIPEQELMSRLFGDKYNVKRFAPGQVQRLADGLVMHDCTTLGGNSGSPIIDLETGRVVGLHFSGLFLRENRGVPIAYVTSRLQKVLSPLRPTDETQPQTPAAPAAPASPGVTLTVPLQLTLSLGAAGVAAASAPPDGTAPVAAAVQEARERLQGRTDVLAVRDGYLFRNGWITPDPAVVVVLTNRASGTPADLGLPAHLRGVPVDVRAATPWDAAEARGRLETLEGLPRTTYRRPTEFALEEVYEEMKVTCHVSPDAGWPVLRDFLAGTRTALTVGMYDFTAPHVAGGVLDAVKDEPKKLTLVLQRGEALTGKPDDIPEKETIARYREKLGDRFDYTPASVGSGHQFASAYHIKVAVRDSEAFWLSSGNWQSSNQPDHGEATGEASWELLMKHNREWHVVVENANLARQFEKYILYDRANAKADAATEAPPPPTAYFLADEPAEEAVPAGKPTYFPPLRVAGRRVQVRPLLTPDNYQEHVLALIETAERRLLFQNQSLSLLAPRGGEDRNDERFAALVDALLAKQQAGVDVRIILRGEFAPVGPLEQLQRRGFDMRKVRLQNRCHTKGIVVDGERVLVGSHNWTNQGTLANRDASLIFEDEEIARYFEEVFWFDWKHLTRQSVGGRRLRPASGDEAAVPRGMRLVSWQEIVNGD
jgi:hypothetical protein